MGTRDPVGKNKQLINNDCMLSWGLAKNLDGPNFCWDVRYFWRYPFMLKRGFESIGRWSEFGTRRPLYAFADYLPEISG